MVSSDSVPVKLSQLKYWLFFYIGLGKYTEYSVTVAARTQAGVGPYYTPGVRVRTAESRKSDLKLA